MASFQYQLYGLNIGSEIALTAVSPVRFDVPDVIVSIGDIDAKLERLPKDGVKSYKTWRASENFFEINVPDVGRYLVTNGNRVVIERHAGADDPDLSAYFMGSAMAAILQQRQFLILHASAVKMRDGAILFMGRSGVGKSTICYALQQRGFSMIADDMAVLDIKPGSPAWIRPSVPITRLWQETIERVGSDDINAVPIRRKVDKFLVSAKDVCTEPQPVSHIYCLNPAKRRDIVVEALEPPRQIQHLGKNTFRRKVHRAQGLSQSHFTAVMGLANSTIVKQLSRPEDEFRLDELVETVLNDLR